MLISLQGMIDSAAKAWRDGLGDEIAWHLSAAQLQMKWLLEELDSDV